MSCKKRVVVATERTVNTVQKNDLLCSKYLSEIVLQREKIK